MLPDTRLIETTHITQGLDKLVFRPKKPSHEFINNTSDKGWTVFNIQRCTYRSIVFVFRHTNKYLQDIMVSGV